MFYFVFVFVLFCFCVLFLCLVLQLTYRNAISKSPDEVTDPFLLYVSARGLQADRGKKAQLGGKFH